MRPLIVMIALVVAACHAPAAANGAVPSMPAPSAPGDDAAMAAALTGFYSGNATFFGGPQDGGLEEYDAKIASGSCGYGDVDPKLWPFYLVAGLAPSNPLLAGATQSGCGTCLEIECVGAGCRPGAPPVQALVTDSCPAGCGGLGVNLHVYGFELLAPTDVGSAAVRYRRVECRPVDPIAIHVDAYRVASGGWLRLSLKNVGGDGSVASVELAPAAAAPLGDPATFAPRKALRAPRARPAGAGGAWRRLNNTYGAAWELSGVPPPPLHMRVTDARGRAIVIADAVRRAGELGDIETRAQLPPTRGAEGQRGATDGGDREGGGGGAEGEAAGAATPAPAGAFVAPGTADVLVFGAADPSPLAADETSLVNATGAAAGGEAGAPAEPPSPAATSVSNGSATEPASGGAGGGGGGGGDSGDVYAVAGFEDADGDGFPDSPAPVVGMAGEAGAGGSGARRLLSEPPPSP